MGFKDLFGDIITDIGRYEPGDWESGEVGARLGEAVLRQISPPKKYQKGARMGSFEDALSDVFGGGLAEYHPPRSEYVTRGGGGGGYDITADPDIVGGGTYRRRRRINPLNIKAARRAVRRIKGVMKITRQITRALPKVHVKSHPFRRRR